MDEFENSWGVTRYAVEGSGPPLLLIHGVGARLENWDRVAAILSRSFKLVRYDLRGHGKSSKVPGPYSLEMFADDAVAVLDHLGIPSAYVAGHSLGGMIAIALAARHPERVSRLAVLSAPAGRNEEERRKVMERIALIASGIPGEHFKNSLSRWFTDTFRAANPEFMEQYAARNRENDPACYAAAYTVLATSEIAPELPRVEAPTLVVTGEDDLGSNPRMARFISAGIPDSQFRILPRLRHSILIEAPRVVAGLLEPFFQKRALPSAKGASLNSTDNQERRMAKRKRAIGGDYVSHGRKLSLSKAIRAGDFVYLTGQVPREGDQPMTSGTIEEQTRVALEAIKATLAEAGCDLSDVVKAMVWLRERTDFPGFNSVFAEYFATEPPARSAVLSELLVDVRVEIEVVAYRPVD